MILHQATIPTCALLSACQVVTPQGIEEVRHAALVRWCVDESAQQNLLPSQLYQSKLGACQRAASLTYFLFFYPHRPFDWLTSTPYWLLQSVHRIADATAINLCGACSCDRNRVICSPSSI